jgi:hypothetical protein
MDSRPIATATWERSEAQVATTSVYRTEAQDYIVLRRWRCGKQAGTVVEPCRNPSAVLTALVHDGRLTHSARSVWETLVAQDLSFAQYHTTHAVETLYV